MNRTELDQANVALRRDQILSAVGFATSVFLKSADWKAGLESALERLGNAAEANRAYYFENRLSDDGAMLACQVAEWVAAGIEPQIDNEALKAVPYVEAGMERWFETMSHRKPIHGLISDFPESERALLEAQDIRSLVAMPVFSSGRFVGFLGFDDCDNLREWSPAEFNALFAAATALGSAMDRQHLENQLRFAQKMEAVGNLAAGVAHDFNNMLQAIVGLTDVVKLTLGANHPAQKELDEILVASDRADVLTRQLLIFSRKQDSDPQVVDLGKICESVATMVKPSLGSSIELSVNIVEPAPSIVANPGIFSQVLLNLCLNARDAMPSGGKLGISCESIELNGAETESLDCDMRPGRFASLVVSDTGCGMDAEVLERIFEPFFTTKETGQGTGLGLSVAYGTIKQCGGFIDVESTPSHGSRFRIYVPITERVARNPQELPPIAKGTETVLLVDDEPIVRNAIRRLLEVAGYTVLMANNGKEGLEVYLQHQEQIALVLTDFAMPEMHGTTLIASILKHDANAKAILISGYIAQVPEAMKTNENLIVLQKPMANKKLHEAIRRLLD